MRWSHLLLPLTPVYSCLVRARANAYGRGWLQTRKLPVPVISVGNLTFGGTGKTPTVISLVRDLVRRGYQPGVLTRGYGRSSREPVVLVGPEPGIAAEVAGDEPVEMAMRLHGVPIVVDGDRFRGGGQALLHGVDVLVLDDGFQYLGLTRDLDLVLVDAGDPWGGGHLPPLGRLREPLSALGRASAVIVSKLPTAAGAVLAEVRERVERRHPGLPVLATRINIRQVATERGTRSGDVLSGRRVFAFSGLGRPRGFAQLLAAAGAEVVGRRWFRDHHRYRPQEVAEMLATAARLRAVAVTTAKDAVKLPADARVWVVEAEVTPVGGSWDELWALGPPGLVRSGPQAP